MKQKFWSSAEGLYFWLLKNDMANKEMLFKGVKSMIWALPLFFIGPSIVYNSFSNQDHPWYYVILTIAVLLCMFGIGLAFRGLRLITNALFESNN